MFFLITLRISAQELPEQDILTVEPEKPGWGDTLNVTLTPAKERGKLVLYYYIHYPEGESEEEWTPLKNIAGIYKTSIAVDTNAVSMWLIVRGEHYLNAACPFIPRKEITVYASDGRPAEEFLGDTLARIAQRWSHAFYEKDSTEVISEIRAFIKELESKKVHTLTEYYALAVSYLRLEDMDIDKSLKLVEDMFDVNPSSALIPKILRDFSYQLYEQRSKIGEEKIDSLRLLFMERNPEKRTTWEMAYREDFRNIPDSLAFKILDKWISQEPKNPIPIFYLARFFQKEGNPDKTLEKMEHVIDLEKQGFLIIYGSHPTEVSRYAKKFYEFRGDLYEELSDFEKALEDFRQTLEIASTTESKLSAYLSLGRIFLKKNERGKVEEYYFEAFLNGDTTESESQLKNLYEERKSKDMTFERYLHQLDRKTKIHRSKAPDFETVDFSGKKARLSKRNGRFLVINFWQRGCPASVMEIPNLNKLCNEFKNGSVDFWAVGSSTEEFLEKNPFNWRIFSLNIDIAQKYGLSSYPQHLIIDPDGFIRYHKMGGGIRIYEILKRVLERLLLVWKD